MMASSQNHEGNLLKPGRAYSVFVSATNGTKLILSELRKFTAHD